MFLIQRSQNKDSVALVRLAGQDGTLTKSHSIEEAESRHRSKHGRGRDAA